MATYDIEINGHEDGLTSSAVEDMVRDLFPRAESVEVSEREDE